MGDAFLINQAQIRAESSMQGSKITIGPLCHGRFGAIGKGVAEAG
ncbi:MAG TPA: hypothetical protein VL202_16665 [Pararhizobium sp.]|nr:hypothetical protein [Pararhizobium sp.]HTO32792.1 hypothetical protein [Pararhizobium sp.]